MLLADMVVHSWRKGSLEFRIVFYGPEHFFTTLCLISLRLWVPKGKVQQFSS